MYLSMCIYIYLLVKKHKCKHELIYIYIYKYMYLILKRPKQKQKSTTIMTSPVWPNGQGASPLRRRLRVRVPSWVSYHEARTKPNCCHSARGSLAARHSPAVRRSGTSGRQLPPQCAVNNKTLCEVPPPRDVHNTTLWKLPPPNAVNNITWWESSPPGCVTNTTTNA